MPTISTFYGVMIRMYWVDHGPPHFHVQYGGDEAVDPTAFARVRVEHGAVTWPGNLDLAPEAMYDAIKAAGVWIPE